MSKTYKEFLNEQSSIDVSKFGKAPKPDMKGTWEFEDEKGKSSFFPNMTYADASKEIQKVGKTKKVYLIANNPEY